MERQAEQPALAARVHTVHDVQERRRQHAPVLDDLYAPRLLHDEQARVPGRGGQIERVLEAARRDIHSQLARPLGRQLGPLGHLPRGCEDERYGGGGVSAANGTPGPTPGRVRAAKPSGTIERRPLHCSSTYPAVTRIKPLPLESTSSA